MFYYSFSEDFVLFLDPDMLMKYEISNNVRQVKKNKQKIKRHLRSEINVMEYFLSLVNK